MLNERQEKFIEYYLMTGNATESAKKAGYSDKGASATGAKLLKHDAIHARIQERLKPIQAEKDAQHAALIADADEVLTYLSDMMRGRIKEEVPLLCGGGEQKLVEAIPNAAARNRAAELMGRKHKLFTDRTEIEGTMTVQLIDDVPKGAE